MPTESQDPVIEPVLLDRWSELDPPLRGEIRQNIVDDIKENIKNRRTPESLANRMSKEIVEPVNRAAMKEAESRVVNIFESVLGNE